LPRLEALEERCLLAVDPILEWNAVALEVNRLSYSGGVVNDQLGPTRSSRALAIVHAAMFDAWNSVNRIYQPYLTLVPGAQGASDDAAVAQAAHDTLIALYPHQSASINAALQTTLARVPDGPRESRGVAVGRVVAQAILNARAEDGSEVPGEYIPTGLPGNHDVDPLNPGQGFLTPAWGDVTTFGIPNVDAIPVRPVPSLTSEEYTTAFDQVKSLGELRSTTRTIDQTEIGIFWGYDVARGIGDPPRLYNQVIRVIATQQRNTEAQNARLFTLVNLAMADAGIVGWHVKYRDDFWRPILAIRAADSDGNNATIAQTDWEPLGAPRTNPLPNETVNFTPPFPAYVSGHAIFGAAAFKTLQNFYQTDEVHFSIPFDFVSDELDGSAHDVYEYIPDMVINHIRQRRPRHYEKFSQAVAENAASRIYLGIHWQFDATEGVAAGYRVADILFDSHVRPLRGSQTTHLPDADYLAGLDAYLNNTYREYYAPKPMQAMLEQLAGEVTTAIAAPGVFRPGRDAGMNLMVKRISMGLAAQSQENAALIMRIDRLAERDDAASQAALARLETRLKRVIIRARPMIEKMMKPV
jgi:hypothetical protein